MSLDQITDLVGELGGEHPSPRRLQATGRIDPRTWAADTEPGRPVQAGLTSGASKGRCPATRSDFGPLRRAVAEPLDGRAVTGRANL